MFCFSESFAFRGFWPVTNQTFVDPPNTFGLSHRQDATRTAPAPCCCARPIPPTRPSSSTSTSFPGVPTSTARVGVGPSPRMVGIGVGRGQSLFAPCPFFCFAKSTGFLHEGRNVNIKYISYRRTTSAAAIVGLVKRRFVAQHLVKTGYIYQSSSTKTFSTCQRLRLPSSLPPRSTQKI